MDYQDATPLEQYASIEAHVLSSVASLEPDRLEYLARKQLDALRRHLEHTRKLLKDCDSEEDGRFKSELLNQAVEQLSLLRKNIIELSQYELFSAVDVAQLSALIEQLIERLR